MEKNEIKTATEQTPTPEELQQKRFKNFLDRLTVFRTPKVPVRNWLAWLGILLFVALVIAYYLSGGAS